MEIGDLPHAPDILTLGQKAPVSIKYETGRAQQEAGMLWWREKETSHLTELRRLIYYDHTNLLSLLDTSLCTIQFYVLRLQLYLNEDLHNPITTQIYK
jgi:hypothetical protein